VRPRLVSSASECRRELLAGLGGRVIELGAGNGLNFAYYPSPVSEVVAVEPESHLRARALEAARGRAPLLGARPPERPAPRGALAATGRLEHLPAAGRWLPRRP